MHLAGNIKFLPLRERGRNGLKAHSGCKSGSRHKSLTSMVAMESPEKPNGFVAVFVPEP
jgi:hypothetical protein